MRPFYQSIATFLEATNLGYAIETLAKLPVSANTDVDLVRFSWELSRLTSVIPTSLIVDLAVSVNDKDKG